MLQFTRSAIKALFSCVVILLLHNTTHAQQTITVGTGTVTNFFTEYPAPYGNVERGARHQMLIRASELQAAGMTAGDISSVAFDVAQAASNQLNGFTVKIATTSATQMTAAWITGATTVYGPLNYIDVLGWNVHPFTSVFTWDGTSNIYIETCFYNNQPNFNPQFNQSTTSFNSTLARSTPNPNVCTSPTGTLITYNLRPNMQFEWTPAQIAPVGNFSQSGIFSCDGAIQFTDLSNYVPTAWAWDFGDGGTSTLQNPQHIYLTDGTYTPSLTVTNAYGSDSYTGNAITISTNGPRPVAACIPVSAGTIAGFGITSVTIGTMTTTSEDAATEGYVDRSCQIETVLLGTLVPINVVNAEAAEQNIRVWIDWDNSGTFASNELVLSAENAFSASTNVPVPTFTTLNTPLRVRVMSDYNFSPVPTPCGDPAYGQAEDYAVMVLENTSAPIANFVATPLTSCNGEVQFTDISGNVPSSWAWNFGDGGTSSQQNPAHSYTTSGTYTVTLIVTNAYGNDTVIQTDYITIDLTGQLNAASCTPTTQSYCCGFGLTGFTFAGISSTSIDGSEGYKDRSCGNVATVTEGASYPISANTGGTLSHDVRVWIDLNNDGIFGSGEQLWTALNLVNPNGTVNIPAGSVYDTPLRLRVMADVIGETTGPCELPLYGQIEDFSVIVSPNQDPPVANFSGSPTTTCTGLVQFTDASTNAPTGWAWNFGDGSTSAIPSPQHQYAAPGVYTVSLTVTNAFGSDSETATNYINYSEPWACDTLTMDLFNAQNSTACQGVLSDDGGPDEPYSNFESEPFTITTSGTQVVVLTFSQFAWGTSPNRHLAIHDGPNTNSPLIGMYNGNGLDQLPNNGVITSTGNSITLQQTADGGGGNQQYNAGFLLTWGCTFTSINEHSSGPIGNVWPQPARILMNVSLEIPSGNGWAVVVRDVLGKQLLKRSIPTATNLVTLDVADLTKGSYFLSVETPDGQWSRMIVLN